MKVFKIILFGLINYFLRFALGGFLYMGTNMNPIGFWYGFSLTTASFIFTLIFLKFVIKPETTKNAIGIIFTWILIALVLDIISAGPVVHIEIGYLLSEIQTWTRLFVMFLAIPLTQKRIN